MESSEGMLGRISKASLATKVKVLAIKLPAKSTGLAMKTLKQHLYRRQHFQPVFSDTEDATKKVILLEESIQKLTDLPKPLSEELSQSVGSEMMTESRELTIGYEQMSMEEVLRKVLPDGVEIPSGFEHAGHIAHLNLKETNLPFKDIIGQVVLDKHYPRVRTVVNKAGQIATKFRTFNMELLAGEDNYNVELSESGCRFKFNFAEVYWNSRLQMEHDRLVKLLSPKDVVCDMFAGVGPFAVPAAKKGCTVHANDLNPNSYKYMVDNAKLNKVTDKLKAYNMDGRDFVRQLVNGPEPVPFTQVIMNLPASAVEFLDVFRGLYPAEATQLPTIHCYGFSSADDTIADIIQQASNVLGVDVNAAKPTVHTVRNVAPKKWMMCLSFKLPAGIPAESPSSSLPPSKKRKTSDNGNDDVDD